MKLIPLILLSACSLPLVSHAADIPADHKMDMHEHMQQMQDQMAAMMKETDPAKKQELMQKHIEAMQAVMQMMQQESATSTAADAGKEHQQHGK
jgi:hypothetical protein